MGNLPWIPGGRPAAGFRFEIQTGGAGGLAAQSGNALIELDSDTEGNPANNNVGDINATGNTNATIEQLVPGTVAGQTYELTFWYAPRTGDGTNSAGLKVSFGGVEVLDIPANANPILQRVMASNHPDGHRHRPEQRAGVHRNGH